MKICSKCILPETYPDITFDEQGECNYCTDDKNKQKDTDNRDFYNEQELMACLEKYKNHKRSKYDVLVPLSGGVDSSNSLITIVEKFKLRALGFHNDNGYEDLTATENVRKLCKALDVDLVITQQELSFMNKLYKYINEASCKGVTSCYICGNIIYINALEIADRFDIPLIINGYSKGQAAQISDEQQGLEMMSKIIGIVENTGDQEFFQKLIDKYEILEKRLIYKSKKSLEQGVTPGKILFIPFYIFPFYNMNKDLLRQRIMEVCNWQPKVTNYPKRTTNCDMIWLNTYADLKKLGYSNYTVEYAELIRKGELTREQALADLEFNPPDGLVEQLAKDVGLNLDKVPQYNDLEMKTEDVCIEEQEKLEQISIDFDF